MKKIYVVCFLLLYTLSYSSSSRDDQSSRNQYKAEYNFFKEVYPKRDAELNRALLLKKAELLVYNKNKKNSCNNKVITGIQSCYKNNAGDFKINESYDSTSEKINVEIKNLMSQRVAFTQEYNQLNEFYKKATQEDIKVQSRKMALYYAMVEGEQSSDSD